jgi:hypothetical protein
MLICVEKRAKKTATQSHKDRVAEYNAKLERLRYVQSPFTITRVLYTVMELTL